MRVRALIGLAVSAVFVALLSRGVSLDAMMASVAGMNPLVVLPAVACYFLGVWLRALRWQRLLMPVGHVPTGRLYVVELIGFAVNNVMPVRLGELMRLALLARSHGIRPAATLGSIVVERVLDGVLLCLILSLGLLAVPLSEWLTNGVRIATAVFALGAIATLSAALAPGLVGRLIALLCRCAPPRLRPRLESHGLAFVAGFAALGRPDVLPLTIFLSIACWLVEGAVYWFVILGFSLDAGYGASLLGMAAANLATVIPSSPGYVGTFHWPLQAVLVSAYGVSPSEATAYTLVTHALIVVPVAVVGLALLTREGISLADLRLGRLRERVRLSLAVGKGVGVSAGRAGDSV